jgi:predicted TPR repeat methyltransferase
MRARNSLPPAYFEDMFAATADPWGFETSAYEHAKYARTTAALGNRRYRRAFEIGCANGVLTEQLAAHCDALLAIDVSETALASAKVRCGIQTNVSFDRMSFPNASFSPGAFDLIVLSEVAYYWDDGDLALAAGQVSDLLAPGADLILVHWIGETDYPKSGDDAVEALMCALSGKVEILLKERTPDYRLDLWRRAA